MAKRMGLMTVVATIAALAAVLLSGRANGQQARAEQLAELNGVLAGASFQLTDGEGGEAGDRGTNDYFLGIDGIDGESDDEEHPREIEVLSWSWGETNASSPARGGGAGAGKVSMQDFHFTSKVSKASPELFFAVATASSSPRPSSRSARPARRSRTTSSSR